MAMQAEHLGEIGETFDGLVRAVVPLYETEVRGVPMLDRVGKALLG
jgi:anion-transporting  ArsA/GET3 family ATPase